MSELGLLDQAMFKLEVAGMSPMYMCGAFILETADSPYPVDSAILADHVAACMEEIPLMRRRLVQDPLGIGNLQLVEDPQFDVRNHISCTSLEAPGDYKALMAKLGEFSGRRLDLDRPLWQFEIIDGLKGGRIAIAAHIHHTIMDGKEGLRVIAAMLSDKPAAGRKPRKQSRHRRVPRGPISLVGDALRENLRRLYIEAPRVAWRNAGPIARAGFRALSKRVSARDQRAVGKSVKVHRTSLNVAPISARRVVSCLELPLAEVKTLHRAFDCSINDLVLLFSSCALEYYFARIGEAVDFDLIAGMPVDVRAKDDTSAGNALSLARVSLHNTIGDIRERLRAIHDETAAIKKTVRHTGDTAGTEPEIDLKGLESLVGPVLLDAASRAIVKFNLLDKATFINLGISNVPGNQIPPYCAGARVRTLIPLAPPMDSLALAITVTSTSDHLVLTYHGCAETLGDTELLVEGARRAFQSLQKASPRRPGRKVKKPRRPVSGQGARRRSNKARAPRPG